MGKRGPPPTPTAILAARGSWRAKGRPHEPKAAVAVPECPDWVSVNELADGKALFTDLAGKLAAVGLMTDNDTLMLALLCDSWVRYIDAKRDVEENGATDFDEKGREHSRPCVAHLHSAWERVVKGCTHFGLSPSARSGLTVGIAPEKEDDSETSEAEPAKFSLG
jgi:P27 family predicted phage terminase small subunit